MYRTALFIDYDNVHSNLNSKQASDTFIREPARWLDWLTGGDRRILLRLAYLNPGYVIPEARLNLLRAGFRVVECPSLTVKGKSSADVRIAIDVLDALAQTDPRYDEFILLSSDSDFTPLLQRVRERDRRTSILALGPAVVAYAAAADEVIDPKVFLREALDCDPDYCADLTPTTEDPRTLTLLEMAAKMRAELDVVSALSVPDLGRIYRMFKPFRDRADWLGYFSCRGLTEAVVKVAPELRVDGPGGNWRVVLAGSAIVEAVS